MRPIWLCGGLILAGSLLIASMPADDIAARASKLHASAIVVDTHADTPQRLLFEKFDLFWDRSPLRYAKNVKTPTLILHSDNDLRVPIEQGEQWYRALKHFGVTTEIVMFPRENHNLTRTGEPKHLVESLNWQLYWFDRFVNGNSNAVPPDQK